MSLNNVVLSIRDYYQTLGGTSIEEISADPLINSTLSEIQKLGESLETADENKIDLLLKIDREIRLLDEHCTEREQSSTFASQTQKTHFQAKKILQSVSEALLDTFLNLDSDIQESQLSNPKFLKKIEDLIRQEDQGRIRDLNSGDILFHKLVRCKSSEARKLALLCLDAEVNIDCKNSRGTTGLHLAAQIGDEALIKEFLKRGADQSIKASTRSLTPMDIAIQSSNYACALALAIEDPFQKIEERSAPEYFIERLQFSRNFDIGNFFQMLDKFSEKGDLNSIAEGIWKACREVTTAWGEERHRDLEGVINWLLVNDVQSVESFKDRFFVVNWLANRMLTRKMSGSNDADHLEKMADRNLFPLLISDSNRSIPLEIQELIKNGNYSVSPNLAKKIKKLTEDFRLSTYEDLNRLIAQIKSERNPSSQSDILRKIEERVAELRNFPNIQWIETQLKAAIAEECRWIEEYRTVLSQLSEGRVAEGVSDYVFVYLQDELIKNNRWDLIPFLVASGKKYTPNIVANKLVYHLMMDKLLFKESKTYESFDSPITAHAIIRALERIDVMSPEIEKVQDLKNAVSALSSHLRPLLEEFILLAAVSNPEQAAFRVVEKLKAFEVGDSLLIPLGTPKHGTCLLVEKTGPKKFRMTHYNTGQGVLKWHYRGKQPNQCQTFDIMDNVPSGSILNPEGWETLFMNQLYGTSMDPIYQIIRGNLGKEGERPARSEHEEDYEAKQSSGTCAMQALMALLRHQTMQLAAGSPSERKALYQIIKSQLFTEFHKDHLEQIDETIHRNLSTVLKKIGAQWTFVDLSADMHDFDEALGTITNNLEKLGESNLAKNLKSRDKATNLSRYATLRIASSLLCRTWLNHPQNPPPKELIHSKALQFAFAKFEHQTTIMQNIKNRLETYSAEGNMKAFAFELYRIFTSSSFSELGIQEAVTRLGTEESPYEGIQQLLKSLNDYREVSEPLVAEFKDCLISNNQLELGGWVEKFWKELEKGSSETAKSALTFD
jgi:hypothetical protein